MGLRVTSRNTIRPLGCSIAAKLFIHQIDRCLLVGFVTYQSIINVGTIQYLLFRIEHELSTRGATVYFWEPSSLALKLSLFLTRLFAVASFRFGSLCVIFCNVLPPLGPAIPASAHWCLSKQLGT